MTSSQGCYPGSLIPEMGWYSFWGVVLVIYIIEKNFVLWLMHEVRSGRFKSQFPQGNEVSKIFMKLHTLLCLQCFWCNLLSALST